jgi:hypothetical protein
MSAPDDELVRRYREASAHEDARPGAHVRGAVRAHAQMLATAAAPATPSPKATAPVRAAANHPRWKISALATVAVVGLTGLLMLQFERGTPEEKDTAYGQRRAEMPAPAAPAPSSTVPATEQGSEPTAPAAMPDAARAPARPSAAPTTAPRLAAPAPQPAAPQAKSAPAVQEAEARAAPGQTGGVSGFPASPPTEAHPSIAARPAPTPPTESLAEAHKRSTAQDAAVGRQVPPSREAAAPPAAGAAAESARSAAPVQSMSTPAANATSSAPRSLDLHDAARAGNTLQVENLIRQGVPVDAPDRVGRTALMLAGMHGQTATVQMLLALGANPALVDREGLNAAQLARQQGNTRLADQLEAVRR